MLERTSAQLSDDPGAADAWATRLASGELVDEPVALVVAHADDETLWTGAALRRLRRLTLIHITDSAPEDMEDAQRLGFPTRGAYADARAAELDAALLALGARPRRLAYGAPDKGAVNRLGDLAERLAGDLEGMAAVLTHPYEGGHPDHDSASLTVRMAVDRLRRATGRPPALVEFACYQAREGSRRFGAFWPDPHAPEHVRLLDVEDRARVDRAIEAHRTQASVVAGWRPEAERWRAAPAYDFTAPPPPGACLYDGLGWEVTSALWREAAGRELAAWR